MDIEIFREILDPRGAYSFQSDFRKSFRTIARKLNVDEATVRSRLRKLHQSGFINDLRVVPIPSLIDLRLGICRFDVNPESMKEDVIRKLKLIQGVWLIHSYLGSSLRITLFFEDIHSLKKQIELISRISHSEKVLSAEILYPRCDIALSRADWNIVRGIHRDPMKSCNAISNETGLSNKTVKRRLERMIREKALYVVPSLELRSLRGAFLAELLIFYSNSESRKEVNEKLVPRLQECFMAREGRMGDPEHSLFVLLINSISQVKETLAWVKQQKGVTADYLDLVEERVELCDFVDERLEKKLHKLQESTSEMASLNQRPLYIS